MKVGSGSWIPLPIPMPSHEAVRAATSYILEMTPHTAIAIMIGTTTAQKKE